MCDGRLHFYDRLQILEEKDRSLEQRERLRAVEKPLLAWYASRARKLPGEKIQSPTGYGYRKLCCSRPG